MSIASTGRRRMIQATLASGALLMMPAAARAEPAALAPIRTLCDSLISVMRAGQNTPFAQRFASLAPAVERAFDLPAILRLSVGPSWATLPADQQGTLLTAFRRYTIANYVSSFNNYTGQRFDVLPDTRSLPNGEQVAQTRIVSSSGESHSLDYVMRQDGSQWKAVDVLADGSISRVAVQRSDFRRLVSRGGAEALLASLQAKTVDLSGGAIQ